MSSPTTECGPRHSVMKEKAVSLSAGAGGRGRTCGLVKGQTFVQQQSVADASSSTISNEAPMSAGTQSRF